MHLSKLILNPFSAAVQRDMTDAYELHRTVMSGFPEVLPGGERVLHRLETDPDTGALTLLVQSHIAPDWALGDYLALPPDVRTWEPQVATGGSYRFRLLANAAVTRSGQRVPLTTTDDQLGWLAKRADPNGFDITAVVPTRHTVVPVRHRAGHRYAINAVQFDGIMRCTAAAALTRAVTLGLGHERAFGCGLLTLARL